MVARSGMPPIMDRRYPWPSCRVRAGLELARRMPDRAPDGWSRGQACRRSWIGATRGLHAGLVPVKKQLTQRMPDRAPDEWSRGQACRRAWIGATRGLHAGFVPV